MHEISRLRKSERIFTPQADPKQELIFKEWEKAVSRCLSS